MINRRLRILTGVISLGVVACLASIAPQGTLAAWSGSSFASGTFGALTVPAPTITGCTASGGFLGLNPTMVINWQAPSGYTLSDASFATIASGVPTFVSPSTTGSAPNYTTTYSSGLLTGILGGSVTIGIRVAKSTWTGPWDTATGSVGLLGLGGSCSF